MMLLALASAANTPQTADSLKAQLLTNYDKTLRPSLSDASAFYNASQCGMAPPEHVEAQLGISTLKVGAQEYSIDGYL